MIVVSQGCGSSNFIHAGNLFPPNQDFLFKHFPRVSDLLVQESVKISRQLDPSWQCLHAARALEDHCSELQCQKTRTHRQKYQPLPTECTYESSPLWWCLRGHLTQWKNWWSQKSNLKRSKIVFTSICFAYKLITVGNKFLGQYSALGWIQSHFEFKVS